MNKHTSAPSNLLRKLFPNEVRPRNGLSACITRACPGTDLACPASVVCIIAVNLYRVARRTLVHG